MRLLPCSSSSRRKPAVRRSRRVVPQGPPRGRPPGVDQLAAAKPPGSRCWPESRSAIAPIVVKRAEGRWVAQAVPARALARCVANTFVDHRPLSQPSATGRSTGSDGRSQAFVPQDRCTGTVLRSNGPGARVPIHAGSVLPGHQVERGLVARSGFRRCGQLRLQPHTLRCRHPGVREPRADARQLTSSRRLAAAAGQAATSGRSGKGSGRSTRDRTPGGCIRCGGPCGSAPRPTALLPMLAMRLPMRARMGSAVGRSPGSGDAGVRSAGSASEPRR